MEPRKLGHAALSLTLFGGMLFVPPLVHIFNVPMRLFGLPLELLYLFIAWLLLIAGAAWLGRHLPPDGGESS